MKKFKLTIGRTLLAEYRQSEREKVFNRYPDLFEIIKTKKDTDINIQLKPRHNPVKQNARPVRLHLQKDVRRELENLINPEFGKNVDEICFVSPMVKTVKSDTLVKNCVRLTETKRQLHQKETTYAEHGGAI